MIRLPILLSLPLLLAFFLFQGCDDSEKPRPSQTDFPLEETGRTPPAKQPSPQKFSPENSEKKSGEKKEEKKKTPARSGGENGGKANEGSGKGQAKSGGGNGGSAARGGNGNGSGGNGGNSAQGGNGNGSGGNGGNSAQGGNGNGNSGTGQGTSSASGTGENGEREGRGPGGSSFGKNSRRSSGKGSDSYPDGNGRSGGNDAYGEHEVPAGWVSDVVKEAPSPDRQRIWNALTAALRELIVAREVVFTPFGGTKTSLTQMNETRYSASGRCVITDEKGRKIPYRFECTAAANAFETKIISVDFQLSN